MKDKKHDKDELADVMNYCIQLAHVLNCYMKEIGVVVAILRELLAFLNDSSIKSELIKVGKREVYKSIINNNEVYFIKSGWGEIDASSATQILVSNFKCEYILNYGVVG